MQTNLWATDGGVYFGHRVLPDQASHHRSLLDEDWQIVHDKQHRYTGDRHLVTIGPNGSGKTRRLFIPNLLMLRNWSAAVIDVKGTLTISTGPYREALHPGSVSVFDPYGVIEQEYPGLVDRYPFLRSRGFNFLAALDPESDDFPDDARELAEATVPQDNASEPHWDYSAQEFVGGGAMAVRVQDGEEASLVAVRDLVTAETDALAQEITEQLLPLARGKHHAIAAKLNRFSNINPDNRELLSILSTAQTKTAWLDSPPIQRELSRGFTDFGLMKQQPITAYLVLPPRRLASQSTWLRLMITAILQPLMRSVRPARVPVLLMLDEFAQLGHLPVIENNLALMREYGVKAWPAWQDLAQAAHTYKTRWESFISNAGVVQSFAAQDVTTRRYLSDLSGQRLYWLETTSHSTSANSGPQIGTSSGTQQGWQNMPGPIFWPQGLGTMEDGQSVLFARGRGFRSWLPDPSEVPAWRSVLARAEREMMA